jgi:hypothetical protein
MTTAFTAQMRRLAGLKFQPANLDTHWEALHDIPDQLLAAAVGRAQRESDEFPSPMLLKTFADELRSQVIPLPATEDRGIPLPAPIGFTLPDGTVLPITRTWKYYCEDCSDTGWKTWWCGPGQSPASPWVTRSVCPRTNEHAAHEWASRCACVESNPAVKRKRESEIQMATRRAKARGRDKE